MSGWRSAWLLTVLAVAGCESQAPPTGGGQAGSRPGEPSSDQATSTAPAEPAAHAVTVTLQELAGAAELEGKQATVTAKVAKPGHFSSVHGSMVMLLTESGDVQDLLGNAAVLTAVFNDTGAGTDPLRVMCPHREVTVTGALRMATAGIWELHSAHVVQSADDPAVRITAEELTRAFVTDQESAKGMYGTQPLRVSGKALGPAFPFGSYAAVKIAGVADAENRATSVVAQFRPEHFDAAGAPPLSGDELAGMLPYKAGDEIELIGTLQFADFGDGGDGEPGLPLMAYPAEWPIKLNPRVIDEASR